MRSRNKEFSTRGSPNQCNQCKNFGHTTAECNLPRYHKKGDPEKSTIERAGERAASTTKEVETAPSKQTQNSTEASKKDTEKAWNIKTGKHTSRTKGKPPDRPSKATAKHASPAESKTTFKRQPRKQSGIFFDNPFQTLENPNPE